METHEREHCPCNGKVSWFTFKLTTTYTIIIASKSKIINVTCNKILNPFQVTGLAWGEPQPVLATPGYCPGYVKLATSSGSEH